jgi:galactokinase
VSGQNARQAEILGRFRALFGGEPDGWVRAPGRAEPLGTDSDDHLGCVLTMAIHLDTWIAFRPSGSSRVRFYSMNLEESCVFELGREPVIPRAWARSLTAPCQRVVECMAAVARYNRGVRRLPDRLRSGRPGRGS